jgi:hypothetical protein
VTEARTVLPTDLLALVSYNGRSYKNEAWTRERVGSEASQNTLGLVLDQFLAFARGRSAWISVRRQRLQGLVGARQRGGRTAWEIDYLIDARPDKDAVGGLLECAIAEVGKSGAEKLFLRIESCSEIEPVVRSAGFLPYQEEVLYARQPRLDKANSVAAVAMRRVEPADSYALFRLYNSATPEVIRRSEAATFGEWHASQERRWLRHGVQLLAEENGRIAAATRAARLPQGILVDVTLDVHENAVGAIEAALGALEASDEPVFVMVPAVAEGVARQLETSGFQPRQEFVSMVCRTTRPLSLPKLVPAIAKSVSA